MENNSSAPAETPEQPADTKVIASEPAEAPKETPKNPEKPAKKPCNKKKIAIIITLVVLILAAGITALFVLANQQKSTDQPTAQKAEEIFNSTALEKYKMQDNSLSEFDLAFLKMENEEKNKIYSPLSIKYALGMLKEAAAGNSQKQIETVIGDYKAKSYLNSSNRSLANVMFIQNGYKDNVSEKYISTLSDKFNASVAYDTFENASNINKWVKDKTLGQIDNLVDDNAVQGRTFALINALAIDMSWKNQIQCTDTTTRVTPCIHNSIGYHVSYSHENYTTYIRRISGETISNYGYSALKFNNIDNAKAVELGADINNYDIVKELGADHIRETVRAEYVKYLSQLRSTDGVETDVDKFLDKYMDELNSNYHKVDQSTDFAFAESDTERVFAKDLQEYDGATLQYIGIMPKNQTLQNYIKNLTVEQVNNSISSLKEIKTENFKEGVVTKVTGFIPLFNYDYSLKLTSDLNELGITDIFDSTKANLSNMLEHSTGDYIADTIHKANIDFSNDGIKAAAATAAFGAGAGGPDFEYNWDVPVETIDITFDQPYFYIIRDKSTGEVWFTGTVYEPTRE